MTAWERLKTAWRRYEGVFAVGLGTSLSSVVIWSLPMGFVLLIVPLVLLLIVTVAGGFIASKRAGFQHRIAGWLWLILGMACGALGYLRWWTEGSLEGAGLGFVVSVAAGTLGYGLGARRRPT